MVEIKNITSSETYLIRHDVLRKGRTFESCIFHNNDNPTTFHLSTYKNNIPKSTSLVFKQNNALFLESIQCQVRGMAIAGTKQKKGHEKLLFKYLEQFLKGKKINSIWLNARKGAVYFYEKLNYSITSIPFEIKNIRTHLIMFKKQ